MKRLALLLPALLLAACNSPREWGPNIMHWSNPNEKPMLKESAAAPDSTSQDASFSQATESEFTPDAMEADAVESYSDAAESQFGE
jgi:hypothetical protein